MVADLIPGERRQLADLLQRCPRRPATTAALPTRRAAEDTRLVMTGRAIPAGAASRQVIAVQR